MIDDKPPQSIHNIKIDKAADDSVVDSRSSPLSAKSSYFSSSTSTNSVSELLEQDNWKTRTKYLTKMGTKEEEEGGGGGGTLDQSDNQISHCSSTSSLDLTDIEYTQLDRYGFIHISGNNPPTNHESDEDGKRRLDEREASRSLKWLEMLSTLQSVPVQRWSAQHEKFVSRLAKGIPDCIRCQIWPMLAASKCTKTVEDKEFRDLYLKISGYERQIDLDIERTLRDHVMFKIRFSSAQISLFKILVAYSNYDQEVGYCQGMSTIAAFLLLYLPEDTAFSALLGVMAETRGLFVSGFPKLFETFYIQERLMRKYLARLNEHLEHLSIAPSIYATKWYLTLFLGFPFALATRIWDLFLFYGFDILPCVSIAILRLCEKRIMGCEYEHTMQLLSKLPEEYLHASQVIRIAVRLYSDIQASDKHRGFRKYRDAFTKSNNK